MAIQTPCPPWCETDHSRDPNGNHTRFMGEFGPVTVKVFAWSHLEDEPPLVSVENHGRPSGSTPEELATDLDLSAAVGFAALMDTLGHAELAGLVRDAIEEIEDDQDEGGQS